LHAARGWKDIATAARERLDITQILDGLLGTRW
jgi:hypothetical protein